MSIRSKERLHCGLCGAASAVEFSELKDRLFGAPGDWGFRRCLNPACGILWQNPMPLTEDLGQAYENYYTHVSRVEFRSESTLRRAYRYAKSGYIRSRYGYPVTAGAAVAGSIFYLLPVRRSDVDAEVRWLPAKVGGRVLDVGCGAGEWLEFMRDLGWTTEGIDFDRNAVATACERGLNVKVGTLADQHYPDNFFDAVALNHVIEHVPDPAAELKECQRILKPGGRLVLATPNCESFGRRYFKDSWRGLEPPRHLQIFSPSAMRHALTAAGFSLVDVRTHGSHYVCYHSDLLRWGKSRPVQDYASSIRARVMPWLFAWYEQARLAFRPDCGECIGAVATK